VKDTSLRVPTSVKGTVIDVQVFTRDGVEKDQRAKDIEKSSSPRSARIWTTSIASSRAPPSSVCAGHGGQKAASAPGLKQRVKIDDEFLDGLGKDDWFKIRMADDDLNTQLERAEASFKSASKQLDERYADKRASSRPGDDLAPGVLKIVKVYLAIKRVSSRATRWPVVTATRV
jgi:DNA-directed RNA polymerase subunit beta